MSPAIYKGGIVFSSNKPTDMISVRTEDNTVPYNLYYSRRKGKKWTSPIPFAKNIKSYLNESSVSFSNDYKVLYLTQSRHANLRLSQLQKRDSIKNGIFQATETGDNWTITRQFAYNKERNNIAFPSLSEDGNKLFFCSDMPGGLGGYDIYVSEWVNGRWRKPKNLGEAINTSENEVFPFYHRNGRLYFSSRGHHEQSDLEIFYTEVIDGEWIKPVRLPRPFNTSRKDDFGYVLSPETDTGYFVSNRGGTDDIYMFTSSFPAFKECPAQTEESFCYEFYETGSMDLDTTSLKYEWDFGDGHKDRNITAEHCFSEEGTYFVSLNVIDTLTGDIYFSEASYELKVESLEQPFVSSPDTAFVDQTIKFSSEKSNIRSFNPKEYFWDFGDGNIANGPEAEHTYTKEGTFYIRLGITDGSEEDDSKRGCSQRQIIIVKSQEN